MDAPTAMVFGHRARALGMERPYYPDGRLLLWEVLCGESRVYQ